MASCKSLFQLSVTSSYANNFPSSFHPAISAVSEWFDKRRALALGLAISGSSIGGVFWPIVVNLLLKTFGKSSASDDTPDAARALKWTFTIMLAISAPLLAIACW